MAEEKFKVGLTRYNLTFQAVNGNKVPIGYASIYIKSKDREKIGHLMGLIRHPDFKGLGVCRKLTMERIMMCKHLGCDKVITGIFKRNKGLIKMYQSLGFEEIKSDAPKTHRRFQFEF